MENARIYTLPEQPPEVFISGFGPDSTRFAAEVGDGYVTTSPDKELIDLFRQQASSAKPVTAGAKACYASTMDEAARIAHEKWPTTGLPGELSQVLPTPAHFEQAVSLVKLDQVRSVIPCGPDPERHLAAMRKFADAGVDELYVSPVGPHYREMIKLYGKEIMPAFN